MARAYISHKNALKDRHSAQHDEDLITATERVPRDANASMRVTEAIRLRAQKLSYEEIAKRCGYGNRSSCYQAVQRELQRTVILNTEELRREELHMLDTLHASIWPQAMDPNNKGRLFAVDRLISIAERRAKLMGLDIPVDRAEFANQIVIREVPQNLLQLPILSESKEA